MRWILDKADFETVRLRARTGKYIDSGRKATSLQRWIFDDAYSCTHEGANLVQQLMALSGDPNAAYVVLDPDPIQYFHRHFKKYPALEIANGDTADDYIHALNEDPGGSPADAVGTNCWEWVIVPPSIKWFIHALRDSDDGGGHLWMPRDWAEQIVGGPVTLRSVL